MYNKKIFIETFSELKASEDTLTAVLKMTTERKNHYKPLRMLPIAAVIILMLSLTITALAVSGIGEMFLNLFRERSGSELTPGQQQLIEKSVAGVGESVTDGDLTITVESVLSDDFTILVKLNVAAPEGVALDSDDYYFEEVAFLGNPNWEKYRGCLSGYSTSCAMLEDQDGKSNTISFLFEGSVEMTRGSGFSFRDGEARSFKLRNFQTLTDEGAVTVFDGVWSFELVYGYGENSVELISEPVHTLGRRFTGTDPDPNDTSDVAPDITEDYVAAGYPYEDVWMTSFQLSPLGATCYYEYWDDGGTPEALFFFWVELVMKDGRVIKLYPKGGSVGTAAGGMTGGSCEYKIDLSGTIVALNEIDFVRLPGNVVLSMPD